MKKAGAFKMQAPSRQPSTPMPPSSEADAPRIEIETERVTAGTRLDASRSDYATTIHERNDSVDVENDSVEITPTNRHWAANRQNGIHSPVNQVRDGDMQSNSKLPTPPRWHTLLILQKLWLPEVACCMFAASAFIGIVILLTCIRNQREPDWPSRLNINTLLAILTAIFKVSMLFTITEGVSELKWIRLTKPRPLKDIDRWDAVSKGPWGSIKFLCKYPGNLLTSIGAAVIILSLAVDPFAQQTLRFYSCLQQVDGTSATIPRTNNYSVGALTLAPGTPSISNSMTASLYKGFLDPPANASVNVPVYCPPGNCTFVNTYTSLAMCSTVQDISGDIAKNGTFRSWMNSWDYQLPSGLRILGGKVLETSELSSASKDDENTAVYAFEVLMVSLDCEGRIREQQSCSVGARAFNVTFWPCMHIYSNTSYSKAVFDENVSSTVRILLVPLLKYYSLASGLPSASEIDCSPSRYPNGSKTQPTSLLPSGRRYANHTAEAYGDTNLAYYDPKCIHEFGFGPARGLESAFRQTFFGAQTQPNSVSTPRGISGQIIGDAWMQTLWANGTADLASFTKFMDGVTASITATMRVEGDTSNSLPALGVILESRTCVGVSWPWITLPAALLVSTLAFLALTLFQSSRQAQLGSAQRGRKPWKSSPLPLLWCGLEDATGGRFHCFDEVKDMENYSDNIIVRLRRTVRPVVSQHDGSVEWGQARWILQEC